MSGDDAIRVHVWAANLDSQRSTDALSPDERERIARFHHPEDRQRHAAARAALRELLGEYAAIDPGAVRFSYGPRGKPSLAEPTDGIHFNLSHSEAVAVYAVALGAEVGVDIERVRPSDDLEDVARDYFSAREVAALLALPAALRPRAFFDCWTRKEAYIKAVGDGLACPLDRFEVTLAPGDPARLLTIDGDETAAERWTMWAFETLPGFSAALAIEARGVELRWRGWL